MTTHGEDGSAPSSHVVDSYLALGGNIGDVRATIRRALAALEDDALHVVARSSDYRTPAWGVVDQPAFINACAHIRTRYAPRALLARCLSVEQSLGRTRGTRWGPRVIDIDVLTYDGLTYADAALTIPHPELLRRGFVLVPLAELAPQLEVGGTRVADALARVDQTGIEQLETATTRREGPMAQQ